MSQPLDVEVGPHLRQRCAWCGAVLVDCDLRTVAGIVITSEGTEPLDDPRPSTWPVGKLVRHDGPMWVIVEHEDGAQLPPECCAALPPSVTVP